MQERGITREDVLAGLRGGEVIENYPDEFGPDWRTRKTPCRREVAGRHLVRVRLSRLVDPCSTASPIINIGSFTTDGITMNADFGANPWPSPGLGCWRKTGHNQFATTFVELLTDAQGALVSRVKLRGTLKYDHKSDMLAGPFQGDVTDPSGQTVLDHFEGTALLTRMQVEPLP